jgi:hypothetical protein
MKADFGADISKLGPVVYFRIAWMQARTLVTALQHPMHAITSLGTVNVSHGLGNLGN